MDFCPEMELFTGNLLHFPYPNANYTLGLKQAILVN